MRSGRRKARNVEGIIDRQYQTPDILLELLSEKQNEKQNKKRPGNAELGYQSNEQLGCSCEAGSHAASLECLSFEEERRNEDHISFWFLGEQLLFVTWESST